MKLSFDRQMFVLRQSLQGSWAEPKQLLKALACGISAVMLMTVAQDLVHSRVNRYSFYLSESLLFKSFWVTFLPILFLQARFLGGGSRRSITEKAATVLFSVVIHALITPLIIYTVSAAFYPNTYSLQKAFVYTLAEDLYKAVLIYSVCALCFDLLVRRPGVDEDKENVHAGESIAISKDPPTGSGIDPLVISYGRKYIPVAVSSIVYITAATPYITIHLEDKRLLHSESLKSMDEKLSERGFARVHKSTIVNLNKVRSYRSRLNGDYDVQLENGAEVRLSRNYVPAFKARLRQLSSGQ